MQSTKQKGQAFAKRAGAQDWTVFPALALFFVCMQLALLMACADQVNAPRQRLVVVFFLSCQLVFALLLSLWRRKKEEAKARRLFIAFLSLGIPTCIAAQLSFLYDLWPTLSLLPACICSAFLPLLWAAFAASTPPGRQGLYLGLSVATGGFVWIALLPFLPNVYEAGAQGSAQLAHLHVVQALVQTVMCGLLIRLLRKRPDLFAAAPPVPWNYTGGHPPQLPETAPGKHGSLFGARPDSIGLKLLFSLFFAEAVFFLLSGFALGTAFPETIADQRLPLYVPVIFLTLAPAIGLLLDKNRHGVRLVVAFLLVCALVISLAPLRIGESGFFLLFFYLGRDSIVLLFWLVMLRLAGGSPFFPLLSALVLSLNGLSHPGMWLAQLVPPDAAEYAAPLVSGSLAVCFAALSVYACSRLKGEVLTAPHREADAKDDAGAQDQAAERDRIFAEHKLTNREKEIAALIFQGLSSREMAQVLHVSENTINSHVRRLLDKFGVAGRKNLVAMFIK